MNDISLDPRIPPNLVASIYNPLDDGNCGFHALAHALYNDENH